MNRVVHIFMKDAAHLRPLISAFVAMLILFACVDPTYWVLHDTHSVVPDSGFMSLARLSSLLLSLSCWLLVTSLIHEETPIGHEQYWLTRPFSRGDLLAAKALFLGAFVHLPVFVCQAVVLAANGFSPVEHFGDLVARQVFLAAMLVLPLAALAAVTKGLGQAFLGVLLVSATWTVFYWVLLELARASNWDEMEWIRRSAVAMVTAGVAAAVLWMQYTRRTTPLARMVLGCGGAMVLLLWAAPPWQPAFTVQRWFSERPVGEQAARITFDLRPDLPPVEAVYSLTPNTVVLEFPIRMDNLPAGTGLVGDWVWAQAGGLKKWRSERWSIREKPAGSWWLILLMGADSFDRVRDAPVHFSGVADMTLMERSSNLEVFGKCFDSGNSIDCLTPRLTSRLVLGAGKAVSVVTGAEIYAPYTTSTSFGPLQKYSVGYPRIAGRPPYSGRYPWFVDRHLVIEHPVAHIERRFDFGLLRLADYQPKTIDPRTIDPRYR